ncbi:MAG: GNAT family N-acetyltransferase [Cyanobacteria bacterium P01_H01_bin.121]
MRVDLANELAWVAEQQHFQIRRAQLQDLKSLTTVLADCFYPITQYQSWLASILKLGIYEDLRQRLRSKAPYYACWIVLQAPVNVRSALLPQESPYATIVGTVELDLRRPKLLDLEQWFRGSLERQLSAPRRQKSSYLYVSNLAVQPASRRRGIARHLLAVCEQSARNWGFREIYLHVLEDNTYAQKLYTQAGYQLLRTDTGWETVVLGRPRRLLMHKAL